MTDIVAILGAGTMGAGIAASCLAAGFAVRLIEPNAAVMERAETRIKNYLLRQVEKGRIPADRMPVLLEGFTTFSSLSAVTSATIVIEAVFEDLQVKRDLLACVEQVVSTECVIATNTSCLRVGDIASALRHPQRFLGLHYFSPAEINPVVELVVTDTTNDQAVRTAEGMLIQAGKEILRCRDSNGFALNRFLCPYCNEAVRCLEDRVATTGQIDAVARDLFDVPIGPFAVMNLTRPRIMLAAEQSLAAFGAFYEPSALLREVGEAGHLWEIEENPQLLPADRRQIVAERLKGAVLLAGGEVVAEGVVDALALDEAARRALRFGKPPAALRAELGDTEAARLVAAVRQRFA